MFKVVTWNVNSIKARLERVTAFLDRERPDLLCLQELKCVDEKFPLDVLTQKGYHCAVVGQKTYNGVAILSREKPEQIHRHFGDNVEDPASRFIWVTLKGVHWMSAYIPNGQAVGTDKYAYKLQWLTRLRSFLDKHFKSTDSVILAGDFNVAPEDRDVHDPDAWRGKILFSDREKERLHHICDFGLVDTFRIHHSEGGFYSWWDYRALSFPFNHGLRIDLILGSDSIAKRCRSSRIDRDERKGKGASDHAPVIAEFEI